MHTIYENESAIIALPVIHAINRVNRGIKGATLIFVEQPFRVHATIETLLPATDSVIDIDSFHTVLMRSLGALQAARHEFAKQLEETA